MIYQGFALTCIRNLTYFEIFGKLCKVTRPLPLLSCFAITIQQIMPMWQGLAHSVFGRFRTCEPYHVWIGASQRPSVPNLVTLALFAEELCQNSSTEATVWWLYTNALSWQILYHFAYLNKAGTWAYCSACFKRFYSWALHQLICMGNLTWNWRCRFDSWALWFMCPTSLWLISAHLSYCKKSILCRHLVMTILMWGSHFKSLLMMITLVYVSSLSLFYYGWTIWKHCWRSTT